MPSTPPMGNIISSATGCLGLYGVGVGTAVGLVRPDGYVAITRVMIQFPGVEELFITTVMRERS